MTTVKASVPKGTRDFGPLEMTRRNFIFDTIRTVFKKYGYQEIQTPAMENLSTLTGKYGEEGDQLIFKILNSGDFLTKVDTQPTNRDALESKKILPLISEKALRYDLTVPFARYVVMHQNEICMPFKRYQIQPVWRADRPQKGRYREFYQCDADVVGSDSLLNEAEFITIYDEVLTKLGLTNFTIKINNRKILSGIAEIIGKPNLIVDMTVAIDKLDKIGFEGVTKELIEKGFTLNDVNKLQPFILLKGNNEEKLNELGSLLENSVIGKKGIEEIYEILNYLKNLPIERAKVEVDITLARGLNYYTGCIFEIKTNEAVMGSIGGGGRYDDLTGMFGKQNLTGVGISFGADRIYDVLEELNLFKTIFTESNSVLICAFSKEEELFAISILNELRKNNFVCEMFPVETNTKFKKQMQYANDKNYTYTIIIGSNEVSSGRLSFKNMVTGEQNSLTIAEIIKFLLHN